VIADINVKAADNAAAMISRGLPNAKTMVFKADVSIEKDIKDMVDATVSRFGRLDIMFNNAGETTLPKVGFILKFIGIMHPRDDDAINTEDSVWYLCSPASF
jgi:NAD(P)-dependent dehydrogenase (short-subunit alcohol dehydrogenase family)